MSAFATYFAKATKAKESYGETLNFVIKNRTLNECGF